MRRGRLRKDGRGVGGVDAADADCWYGGVACFMEDGENVGDAGGANDGFCVFFAVYRLEIE